LGSEIKQAAIDALDQEGRVVARLGAQLLGHAGEQRARFQHGVGDIGSDGLLIKRAEKAPAQQRLSGTDLARYLDEALAALMRDEQRVEGALVAAAGVDELRIRRDAEGRFAQAEMREVHQ
jgi:predicted regulator of Ras-like GTPase activity (Roadblock/LC7/MglB family)